ncbi:TetR/AcrR family transcriptional regulator [Bosea sp. (in: a-proteobacteria)]|uniref:TetR/AcrR family transcriptional regulator n=1 Tax=Bosea sp. (in: a-proteobacteria) TaxID=1871050 RepID=UPI002734C062|nr:TetR/AcrR family transcriptional regulator [Bosea sp. (in: a-proteobacteria)]MDP3255070.1 TetR/AcrR family transcriptional regulator [Bosea sp. (in: a-proteobacteria)]
MTDAAEAELSASGEPDARSLPSRLRVDKHNAILRAASAMFLAEGYDRVTLDQIAQRAGVSKQTIYSHFADKDALFRAICTQLAEKLTIPLRRPVAEADLRSALVRLGEDALAMMLNPHSLDLHRLVMSAATRFPELGQAAYEAGALRIIDDLSALLRQRSHIGDGLARPLDEARSRVLAEQFVGMLRGFHQHRALMNVEQTPPDLRAAYVRDCVDLLLRGA